MVPVTAAVPPNLERGPGVRRPRVSPQGSGHVKSICISLSGLRCARTQTQTHIRCSENSTCLPAEQSHSQQKLMAISSHNTRTGPHTHSF
ncbi:hypothetical protein QQF64_003374 [Cirrhinus molitorella]|uniref:Uncharacterized protein n=1 Tax=Cirrhinus molitorella TaxID=172907 RepID=A0ABR3ML50_9TELE